MMYTKSMTAVMYTKDGESVREKGYMSNMGTFIPKYEIGQETVCDLFLTSQITLAEALVKVLQHDYPNYTFGIVGVQTAISLG